tara:strand:+ start:20577 stop:21692 length:1116 start_codon:yes stop_codon:yes gene_type:complete
MNILLVHVWFWPHVGGGDRHVELLGKELVARGHNVTVWCADVPRHDEREFTRHGVKVVRIPASRVLGGVDPVVSLGDLDPGEFDVVHLHDTLPILIRSVAKKASRIGVPIVTTYHNDYVKKTLSGKFIKWLRWQIQGKHTLGLSDKIIVLRPYFSRLLSSKGIRKEPLVVPTGFEPPEKTDSRPHDVSEAPFFLFLSRLTEQKGVDILLQAWDQLAEGKRSGHKLILAGDGPMRKHVETAASSDPESILYLGLVDEEEKSWLLRNATGLILPSRYEGLPAILLEAAWEGLPVAMSNVNGLGNFTEESGFGVSFTPNDVDSCTKAISEIINAKPERKHDWAESGRVIAATYLWPEVASRIEDIYESVVRHTP